MERHWFGSMTKGSEERIWSVKFEISWIQVIIRVDKLGETQVG
jgi:hypothetical protein